MLKQTSLLREGFVEFSRVGYNDLCTITAFGDVAEEIKLVPGLLGRQVGPSVREGSHQGEVAAVVVKSTSAAPLLVLQYRLDAEVSTGGQEGIKLRVEQKICAD